MGMFSRFTISFEEALEQADNKLEDMGFLPICHNTLDAAFFDIESKEQIEPTLCPLYKENLAYFFYGKASYISKHNEPDELTADLPVCLIFDLNKISNPIYRILPFDSGGFKRYKTRHGYNVDHFTIKEPKKDKLLKLVKSFFYNNQNYLNKELSPTLAAKTIGNCRPVKEYIELLKNANKTGGKFGDQAFAFEIQYKDDPIKYDPKAIVVHQSFFSIEEWDEHIWADKVENYASFGIDLYSYGNPKVPAMTLSEAYTALKVKVSEVILKMM